MPLHSLWLLWWEGPGAAPQQVTWGCCVLPPPLAPPRPYRSHQMWTRCFWLQKNEPEPVAWGLCYRMGAWWRPYNNAVWDAHRGSSEDRWVKQISHNHWLCCAALVCPSTEKRACQAGVEITSTWNIGIYLCKQASAALDSSENLCTHIQLYVTDSLQSNFCSSIRKAVWVSLMAFKNELWWWLRRKYSWRRNKVTVCVWLPESSLLALVGIRSSFIQVHSSSIQVLRKFLWNWGCPVPEQLLECPA